MNPQPPVRANLTTVIPRRILTATLAVALFTACNSALAQGVAGDPATTHDIETGPVVLIGDPNNPMPIDLDPNAQPWAKSFFDPQMLAAGDITVDIIETIENVGTEAWGDWHEHIIGDPASATSPSFWSSVVSLQINGSPITFVATGIGTKDLGLDTFSQPVLPGDILTIHKQVDVFNNTAGADGFPLVRMQEYPTPAVPEPASFVLVAMSSLTLLARKRH